MRVDRLLARTGRGDAGLGSTRGLGSGTQPAGPAALAGGPGRGLCGGRRTGVLGQVVVDLAAAARQREHHQDDGEQPLRAQPHRVRRAGSRG